MKNNDRIIEVNETSVFQIKFCAEKPTRTQSLKPLSNLNR